MTESFDWLIAFGGIFAALVALAGVAVTVARVLARQQEKNIERTMARFHQRRASERPEE